MQYFVKEKKIILVITSTGSFFSHKLSKLIPDAKQISKLKPLQKLST